LTTNSHHDLRRKTKKLFNHELHELCEFC
jgi:hypothetical protein